MDDLRLSKSEAAVLLMFIKDSGMEYLYEYADNFPVDIDSLFSKLEAASESE